jgi:hypothetical protein
MPCERQVSPAGGDDVDHGDDPHDIPQPESEDITQTESEDITQPKASALPVLKENEICLCAQEYAAHMIVIQTLYTTPHCVGSKSFAQHSHEMVCLSNPIHTNY